MFINDIYLSTFSNECLLSSLYRQAVLFEQHGTFYNLSRCNLRNIRYAPTKPFKIRSASSDRWITFLSPILVDECYLVDHKPPTGQGLPSRHISGRMVAGEWERWVCAAGMVMNEVDSFHAQISRDILQFGTALPSRNGNVVLLAASTCLIIFV